MYWQQLAAVPLCRDKQLLLINLPSDVIAEVACYLEPKSIICLTQCCKILRLVLHSHRIWTFALRNTAVAGKVFVPSFPTEQMSIEEVKAVCIRPLKLRCLLSDWSTTQSEDDSPLRPATVRILMRQVLASSGNRRTVFTDLALIPGGRFLLTCDEMDRVCLWDLGCQPNSILQQNPLATKDFPGSGVLADMHFLMQPTRDGQGIVILISLSSGGLAGSLAEVHILEIYPTATSPEFNTVGVRRLPLDEAHSKCHNISPRFFGYHANSQLIFWEYRTDLESRIMCSNLEITDFMIYDDMAVAFSDPTSTSEYFVFKIPQPSTSADAHEVELLYHVRFPVSSAKYSLPRNSWYTSGHDNDPQDIYLDILGHYKGEPRNLRYVLTRIPHVHSNAPPLILLQTYNARNDDDLPFDINLSTVAAPNDERLLVWANDERIWARLSRGPPIKNGVNEDGESVKCMLYEWEEGECDVDSQCQAFCPFSGRLCVISWRGEIRVMDFVT